MENEQEVLSYDDWCDQYGDEIDIELAEIGATMELDFNPEKEYEIRYNKYLDNKLK